MHLGSNDTNDAASGLDIAEEQDEALADGVGLREAGFGEKFVDDADGVAAIAIVFCEVAALAEGDLHQFEVSRSDDLI
jgi:hypothetical protein